MILLRNGMQYLDVLDSKVIYQNGAFTRTKYWLKGHIKGLPYSRFIQGYTGPETEYISETITGRGHV